MQQQSRYEFPSFVDREGTKEGNKRDGIRRFHQRAKGVAADFSKRGTITSAGKIWPETRSGPARLSMDRQR